MKRAPYLLTFLLIMGLSTSASNQDPPLKEFSSNPAFKVKAIYVDSEGVKWFGTSKGLCRYNNLTWRYYTDADHLVGNQVNALVFEETDLGDELWVATTEGVSVVSFDTDGVTGSTSYTTQQGLIDNEVSHMAIDSRHGKFFGSEGGITHFHDGTMDSILFLDHYASMFNTPIRKMDLYGDTLYLAQDGGIGRLISGVDGITGASRWDGDYGNSPFSTDIKSVRVKGEQIQYYGTEVGAQTHTGYFAKEGWDLYSTDEGLVHNEVISIAEDPEGGMWFGTTGGVSHLSGDVWTSFTSADGLLNDTVYDIGFDLDGSVWFGTGAGATRLRDGVFQDFITAVPDQMAPALQFRVMFNPYSATLRLSYQFDKPGPVTARLYNISGMLVGTWLDLPAETGDHQVKIAFPHSAGNGPMEGIYVMQMIHGNHSYSKKMIISY